jgi:glycerol-3-phosphate acyltransferase PlsX
MRIAVDAMGGDKAPEAVVKGAEIGVQMNDVDIILVGDEHRIRGLLSPSSLKSGRITIHHAGEVVGMGEHASAIRTKKDASVVVCANLVKDGTADAMVSAGNTAAAMGIATLKFSRIEGIDRPAIATVFPGKSGPTVVLDAGAVADCSVDNMVQFAVMGSSYATRALGIVSPRVGLLSIGEEKSKGNELTRLTNAELENLPINFIGNVEGNHLLAGVCDVIVADGFTGNVVLKVAEGMWEHLQELITKELKSHPLAYIPVAMLKPLLKRLRKQMDYSVYGGAPLLGLNGVCIIGHGRSNPQAIANAIRTAGEAVSGDLVGTIRTSMSEIGLLTAVAE